MRKFVTIVAALGFGAAALAIACSMPTKASINSDVQAHVNCVADVMDESAARIAAGENVSATISWQMREQTRRCAL